MDENKAQIKQAIQSKHMPKSKWKNYKRRKDIYMPNIFLPSRSLNLEKLTTFQEILFP
jgi:hypothetical protein